MTQTSPMTAREAPRQHIPRQPGARYRVKGDIFRGRKLATICLKT